MVLFAPPVVAQVTTLDGSGNVGYHAALAIGSDGLGLIAYYDDVLGTLKIAHCVDVPCTSATLSTLDGFDIGYAPSITIGGDGLGLVSYAAGGGNVKVAHCLDVPCTTAVFWVIGAGQAGGVATGADGLGLVSWQSAGDVVVTHCDNAACSSGVSTTYAGGGGVPSKVAVGPDGLGLILYQAYFAGNHSEIGAHHCQDPACTSATSSLPIIEPDVAFFDNNLTFGADGRALFTFAYQASASNRMAHCSDPDCSGAGSVPLPDTAGLAHGSLASGPDGFGIWAFEDAGFLKVVHCLDASCGTQGTSGILDSNLENVARPSVAVGQDGFPLIAYAVASGDLKVAHCATPACGMDSSVSIGDATVVEGNSGVTNAVFTVTLSSPSSLPVLVDFATADGTATAPGDYAPASGTLSFAPGATTATITVQVAGDVLYEPDETFNVGLSGAVNAFLGDALGLGTILDDELSRVTTLDAAGNVGDYAAIATGSDGLALISYYDQSNGNLKVAHCSDAACTAATLSTLDSGGDVGRDTAIAIGGDGLGLITYGDVTTATVKVAHCHDLACTTADISPVGSGTAGGVAVGSDGLGLVAWQSAGAVVVTHCDDTLCATHTSTPYGSILPGDAPKAAVGPDGLGFVAYSGESADPAITMIATLHCLNVACTSATASVPVIAVPQPPFFESVSWQHGLAFGADGRAFFSYVRTTLQPFPSLVDEPEGSVTYRVAHCQDPDCSTVNTSAPTTSLDDGVGEAAGADGLGLVAGAIYQGTPPNPDPLIVLHCASPLCGTLTSSPVLDADAGRVAITVGQDALPLIAYQATLSQDLKVRHCLTTTCVLPQPTLLSIGDAVVTEGDSGSSNAAFTVTLSPASNALVTVDFSTADGTATAPADYASTSGTLSFAPGVTTLAISVAVVGDTIDEADETFTVNLSNASNTTVADGQGLGTILDDDDPPTISISDAAVLEGDAGTVDASLMVALSHPSGLPVGVDWQTDASGGATATPGVDFLVASGSLVFAPGETSRILTASVVGDTVIEPDEFFFLRLSNPTNSTISDDLGLVTIVDDDAPSLSFDELVHGSVQRGDLQAQAGPVADVDYYRLAQQPWSSWEVVVDGASGDIVPVTLERLAADNVTVLQTGVPATGGSSVSLRWSNDTAFPVSNQHLSVRSGGCGTTCDASAVYRIRAWETTGRIARFNNSASQVTVTILENTAASPAQGTLHFWGPGGSLLWNQPFSLDAHAEYVLNTATVPALAGASGSITVDSDGSYGSLQGKAVAVEPATGFTFDTPLEYRPR